MTVAALALLAMTVMMVPPQARLNLPEALQRRRRQRYIAILAIIASPRGH
jgi:hypothetical protein